MICIGCLLSKLLVAKLVFYLLFLLFLPSFDFLITILNAILTMIDAIMFNLQKLKCSKHLCVSQLEIYYSNFTLYNISTYLFF